MGNPKLRWLAPPEGMMKINMDASKNLKVASAVAVALNTMGSFLGA
jgi:hypothetical protein